MKKHDSVIQELRKVTVAVAIPIFAISMFVFAHILKNFIIQSLFVTSLLIVVAYFFVRRLLLSATSQNVGRIMRVRQVIASTGLLEKYIEAETSTKSTVRPPESAGVLLSLLSNPKETANILGDLEEKFRELNEKFGPRIAKAWYWRQTLTSIWPFLVGAGGNLVKWGVFGWIAHLLQREHP